MCQCRGPGGPGSAHARQSPASAWSPGPRRYGSAAVRLAVFTAVFSTVCLAWAKPAAPSDWLVPPELGGLQLYKALLQGGAVSSSSNTSVYTDGPLLQAFGFHPDGPLPVINVEGMLANFIWQQHPTHAIDAAFTVFTNPTAANTTSITPGEAASTQPDAMSALDPPSITAAHPSMLQTVQVLLDSPEAINKAFIHINDLSSQKVWLAVAQIKALARGHGACVPPPDLNLDTIQIETPATSTTTTTATTNLDPATAPADIDTTETDSLRVFQCSLSEELQLLRWLVSLLPSRYGLPLLRRMAVGALIQRRAAQQAPFTAPEQRQILLLFLQFYSAHRTAAMRKAVVEFFHISKAGGTSMCSLSQKNGCTTWDAGEKRNCLVYEFDDLPHWVSRRAHMRLAPNRTTAMHAWFLNFEAERNQVFCSRRRHFMLMKGWDMYAHEYTLVGGRIHPRGVQLCTEMVTMLQVRHPYTRLVSHLRWIYGLYHERGVDISYYWPNTTSAHWQHMAPAVADNYYTRSLLGEGIYHLRAGGVTPDHGSMAQLLVAQFDVLLVLEQSSSRRLGLGMGLGWADNEQGEKQRSADDLMARVHARNNQQANATEATAAGTAADAGAHALSTGTLGTTAKKLLSSSHLGSPTDKTHSLIKAATSQGVPKDLGVLLAMNQIDLQLYQFSSWLARFDAAVLETVKMALSDDAYAGLANEGNKIKAEARLAARQRKVAADRHSAKRIAEAMARGESLTGLAHTAFPVTQPVVPVDDPSTCGFAGY